VAPIARNSAPRVFRYREDMTSIPGPTHTGEAHAKNDLGERSNRIRAAVLGANDGIVSIAGLVLGVAGATTDNAALQAAGLAGLVAGALSMGVGEYVSVSSQRDTEHAAVERERAELASDPEGELRELTGFYVQRGLSPALAQQVAVELTANDALAAHSQAELNIEPGNYVNPWSAAITSTLSFTLGAMIPLLAILLSPVDLRVPITVVSVIVALAITGFLSAKLAGANMSKALARNIIGGSLAMGVTYLIGHLFGASVA